MAKTRSRSAARRPQPGPSRTRADKKALARQRKEELRRRELRVRFLRTFLIVTFVSGIIALAVSWFMRPDEPVPQESLPGMLTTQPPWPANTEQLSERLDVLGLPQAGETQHVHANLRIFARGESVAVPVDVGLAGDLHASLHTHDTTGTIHVESAVARDFTLGEFFDVWGVRLTGTCIGGVCAQDGERLQAFVDGEEVSGDARSIVLDDLRVIVLTLGTPEEVPDPMPATFDFGSVQP